MYLPNAVDVAAFGDIRVGSNRSDAVELLGKVLADIVENELVLVRLVHQTFTRGLLMAVLGDSLRKIRDRSNAFVDLAESHQHLKPRDSRGPLAALVQSPCRLMPHP